MASVNKVILIGNLGSKPELKYLPSGQAVCNFSIATNEVWKDKQNVKQEKVEWHRIVVWGKVGENCAQYLDTGRAVYIEGRLQTRSWDDKDSGEKKYMTEIVANSVVFLGSGQRGERRGDDAPDQDDSNRPPPRGSNDGNAGGPPMDDDIPF